MNVKKLSRNPFVYVVLIGVLLIVGMTLITNLTGARSITTQEGLKLLGGDTVTQATLTDGDQRVDLTLSEPFEGATMESLLARVTKPAPSLRAVLSDVSFPPDLFRIVDKLLEREPKQRYQNAGDLLDDLGRFPTLQTTPDFVPPAELIERYATATSQPAYVGPSESQEQSTKAGRPSVKVPKRGGKKSTRRHRGG